MPDRNVTSENFTGDGLRITWPEHKCREAENPRLAGYCDCGLQLPPPARRDKALDADVLADVNLVCRSAGMPEGMPPVLERLVWSRLDLGAERYGDLDYLEKDCDREALEELVDLINYQLFEVQKGRVVMEDDRWLEFRQRKAGRITEAVKLFWALESDRRWKAAE